MCGPLLRAGLFTGLSTFSGLSNAFEPGLPCDETACEGVLSPLARLRFRVKDRIGERDSYPESFDGELSLSRAQSGSNRPRSRVSLGALEGLRDRDGAAITCLLRFRLSSQL